MNQIVAYTGEALTAQLPAAENTAGEVSYSLDRRLPVGVTFDSVTRILDVAQDAEPLPFITFRYLVTDAVRTVYATYRLGIFDRLTVPAPAPLVFPIGEEAALPLPLPEGGVGELQRWADLPDGYEFDGNLYEVVGSPDGIVAETGVYHVRDTEGSQVDTQVLLTSAWRVRAALRHGRTGDFDWEAGTTAVGGRLELPRWEKGETPTLAVARAIAAGRIGRLVVDHPGVRGDGYEALSHFSPSVLDVLGVSSFVYTIDVPEGSVHYSGQGLLVS